MPDVDEQVAAPAGKPLNLPTDPDNVPVRTVNIATTMVLGSVVAMTMMTDRVGYAQDGSHCRDPVIAARLRFDLEMAKILRAQLDEAIKLLSRPEGRAN